MSKARNIANTDSFTIITLTGGAKTATLSREFPPGNYLIQSVGTDNDLEIYLGSTAGANVGYVTGGAKAITASAAFKYVTTANANSSDAIIFTFISEAKNLETKTDAFWSPPTITDITPSGLPNVNNTTTITGTNFPTNVDVKFRKSDDATLVTPKSTVRGSETSIIAGRPDSFAPTDAPYDVIVTNPSTGLAATSLNSITAGTNPVWSTSTPLPAFSKDVAYSQTLLATDTEGSDIDYSIVSGSLPAGLSLNGETGVISGTPTGATPASFTVRATDTGGNFLDRAFTLPNAAPVWTTAAGALTSATAGSAYSFTLVATDDSGVAPSYSVVSGSLPAGLSLNSSTGVISGTPTTGSNGTASSFTVRATDANSVYTDRAFTIYVFSAISTRYTSSGSWTVPAGVTTASFVLVAGGGGGGTYPGSNVGAGGGGAGGVQHYQNQTVTPGSVFTFTVGAGHSQGNNQTAVANGGGGTTCTGFTSALGGGGGAGGGAGGSGGSGGGGRGSGAGGGGAAGQGNNGGSSGDQDGGGGGGGKGSAGGSTSGIQSANAGAGGDGVTLYGFTVGGGGGGGHSDRAGRPGAPFYGTGAGGSGGGGRGGSTLLGASGRGTDGTAGTGGGGGGSGGDLAAGGGGTGGGGCVIISYLG